MIAALWVAAGGAIGAVGRYFVGVSLLRLMGPQFFPWATLSVNVAGSFVMGLLVGLMALKFSLSSDVRLFLTVGVLGGFTTFSTFALDVSVLLERKTHVLSAVYILSSVVLAIGALFAGLALARAMAS
jgi:CrcB protein